MSSSGAQHNDRSNYALDSDRALNSANWASIEPAFVSDKRADNEWEADQAWHDPECQQRQSAPHCEARTVIHVESRQQQDARRAHPQDVQTNPALPSLVPGEIDE